MQNPDLNAFPYIKKTHHIITMMCMNKMSQTFISIDLLQAASLQTEVFANISCSHRGLAFV